MKLKTKRLLLAFSIISVSMSLAMGWYALSVLNMGRELGRMFEPSTAEIEVYLKVLIYSSLTQLVLSGAGIILGILLCFVQMKKPIYLSLFVVMGAFMAIVLTNLIALIAFTAGEETIFYLMQVVAIVLATISILLLSLFIFKVNQAHKFKNIESTKLK